MKQYNLSDPETEQAVLGIALRSIGLLRETLAGTSADCYTIPETKAIYSALEAFTGTSIDITTIYQSARQKCSTIELSDLLRWKHLSDGADLTKSTDLLHEYRIHRQAIERMYKAIDSMMDMTTDGVSVVEELKSTLSTTIEKTVKKPSSEVYHDVVARAYQIMQGQQPPTISTFIRSLDDGLSGGFEPGTLTVIGARPGTGKTALTMWWLHKWHQSGIGSAFISLEMTDAQMARRELAMDSGVFYSKIKSGKDLSQYDYRKLVASADKLKDSSFPRVKLGMCDINRICATITDLHYTYGTKVLVIDYLQRIHFAGKDNKVSLVGDACNRIKALAVQYDMAIILLSQVSREAAKDTTKEPSAHHLRDSGMIEEAADCIIMLHRPDLYGDAQPDMVGKLRLLIEKNRDGESASSIDITANMASNTFSEYHDTSTMTGTMPRNEEAPY